MSRRTSLVAGWLVAALVLAVGGAFLHLTASHRELVARQTLETASAQVVERLDDELRHHTTIASRLAADGRPLEELSRHASSRLVSGSQTGFVLATAERLLPIGPSRELVASSPRLAADIRAAVEGSDTRPPVLLPYRSPTGRWVIVSPTAVSTESELQWVGATIPVDELLGAARIGSLVESGADYRLTFDDERRGWTTVIARSTPTQDQREVTSGRLLSIPVRGLGAGWTLSTWPRPGTGLPSWLVHGVIVVLLALGAGLLTYDETSRTRRLRRELSEHRTRLRTVERDLMDEVEREREIEGRYAHAEFHDAVTGLPNRRYFSRRIEQGLEELRRRPGAILAVVRLSLDRFPVVSETLGFERADRFVAESARRLTACLEQSSSFLARISDSEFAVLVTRAFNLEAVGVVVERLQDVATEPFDIDGERVFSQTSAGIATRDSGFAVGDELLREAEVALLHSKDEGRARPVVFDPAIGEAVASFQQIESDLHRALEAEELRVFYQPIVSLKSGHVVGLEALIRWQHPLEGLLPPGRFLDVAEKTGLMVPMNRWVLRAVCRQIGEWRQLMPARSDYVSTNLTGLDLREDDLADYVHATIQEFGLPPGTLRVEVTESVLIDDVATATRFIDRMRAIGVPLLLDDFGTGYSSLSYLSRLRVDYLKVDRSFVTGVAENSRNRRILRAVLGLADSLEIPAVAEGIETVDDLTHLVGLGCALGQGYFFARPLPADEAGRLLAADTTWPMPRASKRRSASSRRKSARRPQGTKVG